MVSVTKKYQFEPDFAVPPGETLAEVLDSMGMTQKELSVRTSLTVQTINRMINGIQPITFDTANRLELATGVPAGLWNNLEAQFQEQLAKIKEREQMSNDIAWLATIPVKELIKRNIIPPEKDKTTLLRHALAFYGVSRVSAWHEFWNAEAIATRRSQAFESRVGPTSAWIRLGELQASKIECKPYNKDHFKNALQNIRELTVESPNVFVPKMRHLCADSGVALVFEPEMPKAPWHGACKWISTTKAMILLCLRGKRNDQFWFSFFHEAGHILHDSKKELFINDGSKTDQREVKADEFASTLLIPRHRQSEVPKLRSRAEVKQFAKEIGVAPGIIVGRFQFITGKYAWFNNLKQKLFWSLQE